MAARIQRQYPERYARVRANCQWAPGYINLDHHAALIVQEVEKAIHEDRLAARIRWMREGKTHRRHLSDRPA